MDHRPWQPGAARSFRINLGRTVTRARPRVHEVVLIALGRGLLYLDRGLVWVRNLFRRQPKQLEP